MEAETIDSEGVVKATRPAETPSGRAGAPDGRSTRAGGGQGRLARRGEASGLIAPVGAGAGELTPMDEMEGHVAALLSAIGEDPAREGLRKTPARVARALRELTAGYTQDVNAILGQAFFTEEYDEMVIVKDIEIYSLCEHHLLPFFGKCHVAYLPNGKILGLSKIARLVDIFARRLQVQERLTYQIAGTLMQTLQPKGVGVVIEARHLCMTMRGVEKQHSIALTSAMLGTFRKDVATRMEFMNLIRPDRG